MLAPFSRQMAGRFARAISIDEQLALHRTVSENPCRTTPAYLGDCMDLEVSIPSVFAAGVLLQRLLLALALLLTASLATAPLHAQVSQESDQLLHRMDVSPDFHVQHLRAARWRDDGVFYPTVEASSAAKDARDIFRYQTATGEREVLVSAAKLIPSGSKVPLAIENYAWSKGKARLLLYTNSAPVWPQHTRGDCCVLELQSGALRKLGGDAPASSLMFAKFSPDGSKVAYVRANNIYAEDVSTGRITQLTRDGSVTIINGTSDWVYEEELDIRDAYRWSPDGKIIAYWQFNTSTVRNFALEYNVGAPYDVVTHIP